MTGRELGVPRGSVEEAEGVARVDRDRGCSSADGPGSRKMDREADRAAFHAGAAEGVEHERIEEAVQLAADCILDGHCSEGQTLAGTLDVEDGQQDRKAQLILEAHTQAAPSEVALLGLVDGHTVVAVGPFVSHNLASSVALPSHFRALHDHAFPFLSFLFLAYPEVPFPDAPALVAPCPSYNGPHI